MRSKGQLHPAIETFAAFLIGIFLATASWVYWYPGNKLYSQAWFWLTFAPWVAYLVYRNYKGKKK